MRRPRRHVGRRQRPVPAAADVVRWEELGVPADAIAAWRSLGFGPFEAALARGDGFTPSTAAHCRRQLQQVARRWARYGLDSAEGLAWHRAGHPPAQALRLRDRVAAGDRQAPSIDG
jgi:hypothetical protein